MDRTFKNFSSFLNIYVCVLDLQNSIIIPFVMSQSCAMWVIPLVQKVSHSALELCEQQQSPARPHTLSLSPLQSAGGRKTEQILCTHSRFWAVRIEVSFHGGWFHLVCIWGHCKPNRLCLIHSGSHHLEPFHNSKTLRPWVVFLHDMKEPGNHLSVHLYV